MFLVPLALKWLLGSWVPASTLSRQVALSQGRQKKITKKSSFFQKFLTKLAIIFVPVSGKVWNFQILFTYMSLINSQSFRFFELLVPYFPWPSSYVDFGWASKNHNSVKNWPIFKPMLEYDSLRLYLQNAIQFVGKI